MIGSKEWPLYQANSLGNNSLLSDHKSKAFFTVGFLIGQLLLLLEVVSRTTASNMEMVIAAKTFAMLFWSYPNKKSR
jgi:hypothetical protein